MLSGQADGWRLGWGELAGRGMAAWITTQQQIPEQSPVTPQQDPRHRRAQQAVEPPGQAAELVRVLAGMALACIRPTDN